MMQGFGNYQFTPPMTTTPTTTTATTFSSSGSEQYMEGMDFEVSHFLSNFEEWGLAENESMGLVHDHNHGYQRNEFHYDHDQLLEQCQSQNEGESSIEGSRNFREKKGRVAFRMRSDVDVVEDGYKWRKYGKKMVKNSPNPRNYYRWTSKKRVERDREDPHYVITTYENIHTHEAPRR